MNMEWWSLGDHTNTSKQHGWASTLPSFRRPQLISKTQVQLVSTNPLVPTQTALPWKPFIVQHWKLCGFAYMLNPGLHFLHFYMESFNFLAAKLCHLNNQMELTTLAWLPNWELGFSYPGRQKHHALQLDTSLSGPLLHPACSTPADKHHSMDSEQQNHSDLQACGSCIVQ